MNDANRIERVLELVLRLASGDLDARMEPLGMDDPLDGVTEGLNMLAEELSSSMTALRRSEKSFRTLIERSPDAILVHRDDRLVYVNEALLALLGYQEKSDVIGKQVEPLFDFEKNSAPRLASIPGSSSPPATREGRMVHRDGMIINVEVASIPIVFDGNAATLTTVRDISARKQLTAKMMELDRMIAVGTLAAGVGHEINNPLAYIITNLEYALDQIKSLSDFNFRSLELSTNLNELSLALSEAYQGAERVRQIVTDLKTFSRSHSPTEEKFELGPVLESAINMAFNEIRHRARLMKDFEETPIIIGNPSRLSQVFLNLLVNAAHSIPEGAAHDNSILVRTKTTTEEVQIEIIDTGRGIEPEHIPRIFDPFFTTKSVGQGTGLGLYICRRIVQDHGGEIEVRSEHGKGSTFRVLLPVRSEKAIRPGYLPRHSAREEIQKARILIVDDEPNICRSLVRLLGRNHEVASVTDARQALEQFIDGKDYDIVLCDIMMPEMTGVELYRETVRCAPQMAERMFFFTGGAFSSSSRAFVEQMKERCLEKPLDMKRIQQIIQDKLEARRKDETSHHLQRNVTLRSL